LECNRIAHKLLSEYMSLNEFDAMFVTVGVGGIVGVQ